MGFVLLKQKQNPVKMWFFKYRMKIWNVNVRILEKGQKVEKNLSLLKLLGQFLNKISKVDQLGY